MDGEIIQNEDVQKELLNKLYDENIELIRSKNTHISSEDFIETFRNVFENHLEDVEMFNNLSHIIPYDNDEKRYFYSIFYNEQLSIKYGNENINSIQKMDEISSFYIKKIIDIISKKDYEKNKGIYIINKKTNVKDKCERMIYEQNKKINHSKKHRFQSATSEAPISRMAQQKLKKQVVSQASS